MALDVRVEIRADAEDQRAGRRGRRLENEVDEQFGVRGAQTVRVALDLSRRRLGVKLLPLVDIEEEARAAAARPAAGRGPAAPA